MHRLFRLSNCGYNKVYISYHLQMNRLLPSLLLVLWGFLAFADDAYFQEQLAEARKGDPIAQFNMGIIYLKGDSAPPNHAEAVKWFLKAANQEIVKAQSVLGYMYKEGLGVIENNTEAVKWYQKAANEGDSGAQTNLGAMYLNGDGVTKNNSEALKWFRKAADQGGADAQFNLGVMYNNYEGIPANVA